jgi:serine/threonine protein kinase
MPAPPQDGWVLAGRYRVLDRIGSGGMAEVFRARDELLAREVAVKVFRRELDPADTMGAQRQEIELQVLAQLSHPNLITLFDGRIAEADGPDEQAYLVLELVNGPSLAARIAEGPLPEAEVRAVAIQICHALSYVHGKGMVHRDVKPANILLGFDDVGGPDHVDGAGQVREPGAGLRARLSDFGIVRLLDSAHLTDAQFMLGTASYLSPEQARGAEVGPPTDVYAFGLVLLEALTGERTFPGPAMPAMLARLDGPPPIPDDLAEPWPGVLAAMTAMEPADRPSAAQVAAVLSAGPAPVGLLAAADNTVRLAALPVDALSTQLLPAVTGAELADTGAAEAGIAGAGAGARVAGAGVAGAGVAGAGVAAAGLAGAGVAAAGLAGAGVAGATLADVGFTGAGLAGPGLAGSPGDLTGSGSALAGQRPVAGHRAPRRGGRGSGSWLPWLLAAAILGTATVVALLVHRALTVGSPASSPGSSTVSHSTPATTAVRTSHPVSSSRPRPSSAGSSQTQPRTTVSTSSAPRSSAAPSSTPPASSRPASSTPPASSASGTASGSGTASSTATAAPVSVGPTGSPTASAGSTHP